MNWIIPCHIFNSLAEPYLEALDDMIDEEEGELEEDDDKEEAGQENQEEQINDDLYRKLIEDELSDSDLEYSIFIL